MDGLSYDMDPPTLFPPVAPDIQFSYSAQDQFVASQGVEGFDTDMTFDSNFQTHILGDHFTPGFLDSASISHNPDYSITEDRNDSSNTNTTTMKPPGRSRKRKAPTLRAESWEPYKTRIVELHIVQDLPLKDVKQKMEEDFGFSAEIRQYRTRISQWGLDKNVKPKEMRVIVKKRQQRKLVEPNKAELAFTVRGKPVPPENIDRWMKSRNIPESFPYSPSAAASTPSAVDYRTISNRSTPVLSPKVSSALPMLSPRGMSAIPPSPHISSPALSSIILSQSNFAGRSPAPINRSLPSLPLNPFPGPSAFSEQSGLAEAPGPYRYKQAEETQLRDELSRATTSLGESDPKTLCVQLQLGLLLMEQGRYKSAEKMARKSVQDFQKIHGNKHATTLEALDLLGVVFIRQGHYSEGKEIFSWGLEIRKSSFGHEHVGTLISFGRLGEALWLQKRFDESELMLRTAVEGLEKNLGPEHKHTIISKESLAFVLNEQGSMQEAEVFQERVLNTNLKVFGEEHQSTLRSMNHLASIYRKQGLWKKAEKWGEQSLSTSTKVLGAEHPDTLASMHTLAITLKFQGRVDEALLLMKGCLELRNKVLGPDHPDTRGSVVRLKELQFLASIP